jgi:hypothetical protein
MDGIHPLPGLLYRALRVDARRVYFLKILLLFILGHYPSFTTTFPFFSYTAD